jgi:hypothetical protein
MQLSHVLAPPEAADPDRDTRSLIEWSLLLATLDEETSRALHAHAVKVGADLAITCHAARAVDRTAVDLFGGPPSAAMRRTAIYAVASELERLWRDACQPEPAGARGAKENRE